MKRLIGILLILITMFSFSACKKKDEPIGIKGKITEINIIEEEIVSILVEGNMEDDTMYDKASVGIEKKTKIYKNEEEIKVEDLKGGEIVEIIFEGPIAESYPVQAVGKTIKVIE